MEHPYQQQTKKEKRSDKKMIIFNKHIENDQLEVALTRGTELTKELKQEIRELEKDTRYKYHYVYSYNIDTTELQKDNVTLLDEKEIYIGEGNSQRLLDEKRPFHNTEIYNSLIQVGAKITRKVDMIYRTTDMDLDIKSLAQQYENSLIRSLAPIFNGTGNRAKKLIGSYQKKELYILLEKGKVKKVGSSFRELESDLLKKSQLCEIHNKKIPSTNGVYVARLDELDTEQKIQVEFLIFNTQEKFKEIEYLLKKKSKEN